MSSRSMFFQFKTCAFCSVATGLHKKSLFIFLISLLYMFKGHNEVLLKPFLPRVEPPKLPQPFDTGCSSSLTIFPAHFQQVHVQNIVVLLGCKCTLLAHIQFSQQCPKVLLFRAAFNPFIIQWWIDGMWAVWKRSGSKSIRINTDLLY